MAHPRASVVRADLSTATRVKYRMEAEKNLVKRTLFHKWGEPRPLERGHSSQQLHRFDLGAENTDTLTENEVGAGSSISDRTWSMQPARYGDFAIITQEVEEEVYSNWKMGLARAFSARAALTIDRVSRSLFDTNQASTNITPITAHLTRQLLGQVTSTMGEATIMGAEGLYPVVVSPITAYDLLFDSSAGSVQGLADGLDTAEIKNGTNGAVITRTAGAVVYSTTEVAAPASNTRRCYAFGEGAYAYTHFAGTAPQFGTKSPRNFNFITHRTPKGSIQDPIGRIRMSLGYAFSYALSYLDGGSAGDNYRVRTFTVSPTLLA